MEYSISSARTGFLRAISKYLKHDAISERPNHYGQRLLSYSALKSLTTGFAETGKAGCGCQRVAGPMESLDFWDKLRALFIHGAKAHFPAETYIS
jgi:hypothetical protein